MSKPPLAKLAAAAFISAGRLRVRNGTWQCAPVSTASSTRSYSPISLLSRDREAEGQRSSQDRALVSFLKTQLGHTKVRHRDLVKNTARIVTLFALLNLWTARRRLIVSQR